MRVYTLNMAKRSHRRVLESGACTCFNLRKAARAVTQLYDGALAPVGLRATQFTILAIVAEKGPIGLTALADRMVMDRTTLTRNLRPLQRRGLVTVAPGEDRRERRITLTATGEDLLAAARSHWLRAQEYMADGLGNKGLAEILVRLDDVVAVAREF